MLKCQEALPQAEQKTRRMGAPRSDPAGEGGNIVNDHDLKRREEQKRDAAYDPVQRWQHIQQTITWAEAKLPLYLRRNRGNPSRSANILVRSNSRTPAEFRMFGMFVVSWNSI
jgi:hypothetical protein